MTVGRKSSGPLEKERQDSFLYIRKIILGSPPYCDLCLTGTSCPKHISHRTFLGYVEIAEEQTSVINGFNGIK